MLKWLCMGKKAIKVIKNLVLKLKFIDKKLLLCGIVIFFTFSGTTSYVIFMNQKIKKIKPKIPEISSEKIEELKKKKAETKEATEEQTDETDEDTQSDTGTGTGTGLLVMVTTLVLLLLKRRAILVPQDGFGTKLHLYLLTLW